ncbi:ATP-binding protein [Paenibacillus sp. R14(2021)]|uniref:ATP-binding protein n=1 Tax=Paenibacillus sp. R14(2021) TaxID=2859228 RepID=UPI001C6125C6|nr:ATP-binding protein [Paenibacillus sp. R14(2021)]
MKQVDGRSILKGTQVEAKYAEQQVPAYRGNPLIESQPHIKSILEVANSFAQYPDFDHSQREWPANIRMHCVYQLQNFLQPLPLHFDMETRFSVMIRQGYVSRNPTLPIFQRQFSTGIQNLLEQGIDENGYNTIGNRASANGFCILGPSGIGKSTSVEKILLTYPQVILHKSIKGMGMLKQLNWLKLECPSDGSLKSLCVDFFHIVDEILKENYSNIHVKERSTAETLTVPMAQIASLHCLGVLVIDEIQNLNLSKTGGEERTLNFFTKLVNVLGIPIVLVGTGRATYLFESVFAQARRASGMGDMVLDRLTKGKDWEVLLNSIWSYQWTKNYTERTEELSEVLYSESQGIVDIAVKLFMHSQWKAISTKKETISVEMVKKAASENLKLIQPMIRALRSGDREKLAKIKDLKPEWLSINQYVLESEVPVELYGKAAIDHRRAQEQRGDMDLLVELMKLGEILGLGATAAEELGKRLLKTDMTDITAIKKSYAEEAVKLISVQPKRAGRRIRRGASVKNNKLRVTDALSIVKKGLEKGSAAVQSLKDAGLTAGFDEFV